MSFGYRHRKEIIICLAIIFSLIAGGFYYYFNYHKESKNKDSKEDTSILAVKKEKEPIKKENNKKPQYQVDIKGEVNTPGIYALDSNKRVIDVINMAGGLTENADTTVINLSKKISDEMVIIIYSKSEVADFKKTTDDLNKTIARCEQKDETSLKNDACIAKTEEKSSNEDAKTKIININTATLEEFQSLPGIGESKAQNIIKYRTEHEHFTSIEEIKEVEGIGDNLYAQIKAYLTIE